MTNRENITVRQGETFKRVIRWETDPIIYKAITAITQAAPIVITAVGHGLKEGWRVQVESVLGMTEINDGQYHPVTVTDVDTITLNDVNSAGFRPYKSGGYLRYNTPHTLTGFTARMDFKDRIGGTVLDTLTDANGKILLDNTNHTITLLIDAVSTAAYTWKTAVYDLELVSPTGEVTTLLAGAATLINEVTT
jgi:hypothetical protein